MFDFINRVVDDPYSSFEILNVETDNFTVCLRTRTSMKVLINLAMRSLIMSNKNKLEITISKNDQWAINSSRHYEKREVKDSNLINLTYNSISNDEQNDILERLKKKGVPFFCYVEGEHIPYMMVYSSKEKDEMVIDTTCDREFFIVTTDSGEPNFYSRHYLKQFLALLKRVKVEFEDSKAKKGQEDV